MMFLRDIKSKTESSDVQQKLRCYAAEVDRRECDFVNDTSYPTLSQVNPGRRKFLVAYSKNLSLSSSNCLSVRNLSQSFRFRLEQRETQSN